jgi:hypothetical protein
MAAPNTTRHPCGGASSMVIDLDEQITIEDSANTNNGQVAAKSRCPGCARKCRKFVPVHGWAAGREALICERCAAGLILDRGHVTGLKLRPEARL